MNAVLIAWVASVAFCSLYTLILPSWDAYIERRKTRQPVRRAGFAASGGSAYSSERNTQPTA